MMASAFTVRSTTITSIGLKSSPDRTIQQSICTLNPLLVSPAPTRSASRVILQEKKKRFKVYEESEKRGNVLFAIVLVICIWSFSIPPELRREHICFSEKCRLDNTGKFCYDCINFSELTGKISDYYKGGGGVNFDFSVEEK